MDKCKEIYNELQKTPGQLVEIQNGIVLRANHTKIDYWYSKDDLGREHKHELYCVSETGISFYCIGWATKIIKPKVAL